MAEIILEPYAIQQNWRLPGDNPDWLVFLDEYLQQLTRACQSEEQVVIGHIKGLALFPEGGFFRISKVDSNLPATTEGQIPDQTQTLDLTLNLIVYGLEYEELLQITEQATKQMVEKFHGEVINKPDTHSHQAHP